MRLSLLLGAVYFFSELLLTLTRRSRTEGGVRQDRSTLRVLWLVIMGSIFAAIYVASHCKTADFGHRLFFAITGVLLFVGGLILRWWAIVVLGRFFTVDVQIAKDHRLVESGPFRLVRHPSYTGALMAFLGFAITLQNWAAILVLMLPIVAAFIRRMNVEEQALTTGLGVYLEYKKRTKRLIPFVY